MLSAHPSGRTQEIYLPCPLVELMEMPERSLRIVIPFKSDGCKSRLSSAMSPEQRRIFARAMLGDVLEAVYNHGRVTVLSRPDPDLSLAVQGSFEVVESGLGLNDALNSLIQQHAAKGWNKEMMIVMADLPLISKDDIAGMLKTPGEVVLSAGRGGGTNLILIRNPRFRTCYTGQSFLKHRKMAELLGFETGYYSTYRTFCDIDLPEDLTEVLIHGTGRAKALLERLGFRLNEE